MVFGKPAAKTSLPLANTALELRKGSPGKSVKKAPSFSQNRPAGEHSHKFLEPVSLPLKALLMPVMTAPSGREVIFLPDICHHGKLSSGFVADSGVAFQDEHIRAERHLGAAGGCFQADDQRLRRVQHPGFIRWADFFWWRSNTRPGAALVISYARLLALVAPEFLSNCSKGRHSAWITAR